MVLCVGEAATALLRLLNDPLGGGWAAANMIILHP